MAYLVYKPAHCKAKISIQFVNSIENAFKLLNIRCRSITKMHYIKKFDVVFCYLGSDYQNGKFMNTENCSIELSKHISEIENIGATCYPSSYLVQFYENKRKLLELFKSRNVKYPETFYVPTKDSYIVERDNIAKILPCVIKFCYSCGSNFMDDAYTIEDLDKKLDAIYSSNSGEFLIQKKIFFTKEARLSYVNDIIFHGYYRIKPSAKTLSGATKFGSTVNFDIDTNKYVKFIKEFVEKTNFYAGGIDICWENDDLDSEPYVLEVSHYYEINPPHPDNNFSYNKFKYSTKYYNDQQLLYNIMASYLLQYTIAIEQRKIIYCDIDCTISDSENRIKTYSLNNQYQMPDKIITDVPIDGSVEALNIMFKKYKIIFITSRKLFLDGMNTTKKWLLQNNFNYHGIIFTSSPEEKIDFFDKEKEYIFIDDLTTNHHVQTCDDKKTISILDKLKVNYLKFDKKCNNWSHIIDSLAKF